MKKLFFIITILMALSMVAQTKQSRTIRNGELWNDDFGQHINAHGGGIMKYGDTYYWHQFS